MNVTSAFSDLSFTAEEQSKPGNALKKKIVLILPTDHSRPKLVIQASDRDWPACFDLWCLSFVLSPLPSLMLFISFLSHPSIFFLHSHSVYCLCCGPRAVLCFHSSLQLVRTRPSDPTTEEEQGNAKKGNVHKALQRSGDKQHISNNKPLQVSLKQICISR